ncbi:MAG TPA: hypothetical protein VKR53_16840 [Puia sp.]|nr:hypothetical protein [Puia sp.]
MIGNSRFEQVRSFQVRIQPDQVFLWWVNAKVISYSWITIIATRLRSGNLNDQFI